MNDIESLPLYPRLDAVADRLAGRGVLMLHAEPGAGKTTLVPWRLLTHEKFTPAKILLLQPRRIAARAAAERIAAQLGQRIGETVGLRTREETLTGPTTRLEVVTEGVLTRIIQNDPSLTGYGVVIFDEFHERSLQGEMALAFTRECRETCRSDLSLLFMSATPPTEELRASFGELDVLTVSGRTWPVEVLDRPPLRGETPWGGAARLAAEARDILDRGGGGTVLVFLPGFSEIMRAREKLLRLRPGLAAEVEVLHGRLPPGQQRRVLSPPAGISRRIILSTNVAETSVTIPSVHAVVDSGLERRVRFHPRTGMDHWETVEISAASALQRQGRAGRLGPGICLHWWRSTDPRRDFSNPEILEADLAPLVLETALWGAASPLDLKWMTPPPSGALKQAASLLGDLGLIDGRGRITGSGRKIAAMGLHPRLGRMVLEAAKRGWLATAALAAAVIEEGTPPGGGDADFRESLLPWATRSQAGPQGTNPEANRRISREAQRIARVMGSGAGLFNRSGIDPSLAGPLLLLAYPERAAQRVGGGRIGEPARFVLTSGRAARVTGALAREDFLAVADLDGGDVSARVFMAAPVSRSEVESFAAKPPETMRHFTWEGWTPRCRTELRIGRIVLDGRQEAAPPPEELRKAAGERLHAEGLSILPWNDATRRYLARCRFVQSSGRRAGWPDFSPSALLFLIDRWLFPFGNWEGGAIFTHEALLRGLALHLGRENRRTLDELAPETWKLSSGTSKGLDYDIPDGPVLAARIQEFFGCRQTPQVCGRPVTLHLLSPAGRPVQITRDLDGFWERSYPDVKKELMGRYPRHPWPEDPRLAVPTARAKRRNPK